MPVTKNVVIGAIAMKKTYPLVWAAVRNLLFPLTREEILITRAASSCPIRTDFIDYYLRTELCVGEEG
jgi:hypothetical protein